MKKFLLTSLLWLFVFVGFTNADSYTFVWDLENYTYSPGTFTPNSSFTYSNDIANDIVDYICNSTECDINFDDTENGTYCEIWYSERFWSMWDCNFIWWKTYEVIVADWYAFDSFTFNINSSSGGWSSSWILSGWSSAFNGLLWSVWNTIQEFIPYVIQISLWIIMAIIWFVAIKRLMYWIRAKVLWTFSSRKRR